MFFWNSLAFSMIQRMLAIWSLVPLPFLKPAWTSGSSRFMYCWSLAWRILNVTLLACEMSANCTISLSSTKLGDFNIENWGTHPTHTIFFTQHTVLSSYYDQYCKGLSASKHLTSTAHVCILVLFLPSKEKLLLLDKEWLAKVTVISQPEENAIYPLPTYKTQSQERRQIPQATP